MPAGKIYRYTGKKTPMKKLQKDVRKIKSNIRSQELKFTDTELEESPIGTGGAMQAQLFEIPQNDTQSGREGRKIVIKQMQFNFRLKLPNSDNQSNTTDTVRIIILKDKQANLAIPAITTILQSADILSFKSEANKNRFVFYYDRYHNIDLKAGAYDGTNDEFAQVERVFKWKKKLNVPIMYNNALASGVIATITSNNIIMLLISNRGLCALKYNVRFTYQDN